MDKVLGTVVRVHDGSSKAYEVKVDGLTFIIKLKLVNGEIVYYLEKG